MHFITEMFALVSQIIYDKFHIFLLIMKIQFILSLIFSTFFYVIFQHINSFSNLVFQTFILTFQLFNLFSFQIKIQLHLIFVCTIFDIIVSFDLSLLTQLFTELLYSEIYPMNLFFIFQLFLLVMFNVISQLPQFRLQNLYILLQLTILLNQLIFLNFQIFIMLMQSLVFQGKIIYLFYHLSLLLMENICIFDQFLFCFIFHRHLFRNIDMLVLRMISLINYIIDRNFINSLSQFIKRVHRYLNFRKLLYYNNIKNILMSLQLIKKSVKQLAKPQRCELLQRFFKTSKGQYAQGDIFVGLTNPESRKIAKQNKSLSYSDLSILIKSSLHEERFIALIILIHKFNKQQNKCYDFYLNHLDFVNNWDLVDCSCYKIIGKHLIKQQPLSIDILLQLAKSQNLWKRRISIVSTFAFIKQGHYNPTLQITKLLLYDKHDLIHKAMGWMLRQVGNRKEQILQSFLIDNYDSIPRTTLRYAIQKFQEKKRKRFLNKLF